MTLMLAVTRRQRQRAISLHGGSPWQRDSCGAAELLGVTSLSPYSLHLTHNALRFPLRQA